MSFGFRDQAPISSVLFDNRKLFDFLAHASRKGPGSISAGATIPSFSIAGAIVIANSAIIST